MSICDNSHGSPLSEQERNYQRFLITKMCKGCDLSGLDLEGASYRIINLQGANLELTDLRDANLEYISFNYARLRGVDYTGATLNSVSFIEADLRDAIFEPAVQENVEYCRTIMPDGTRSDRDCNRIKENEKLRSLSIPRRNVL